MKITARLYLERGRLPGWLGPGSTQAACSAVSETLAGCGRWVVCVLLLACAACSAQSPTPASQTQVVTIGPTSPAAPPTTTPAVVAQPPPTAALTPTPPPLSPTLEPVPTATLLPPTLELPPVPSAALDKPLAQAGPWGLLRTADSLWLFNPDGSGLTRLDFDVTRVLSGSDWQAGVAPHGGHLAFVTSAGAGDWNELGLAVLALPDGHELVSLPLLPPGVQLNPSDFGTEPLFEAARAIVEMPGSLAWSPDGRQLAFVGAQDGESADVYVYSVDTGQITRLTDGPSQAYQLSWSPDGQYIFHTGASSFGTGAGFAMAGVWAARGDGSGITSLYEPASGGEELAGWVGPHTVVVNSWSADCGSFKLRSIDIETGQVRIVWENCFSSLALDPASGAAALVVDKYVAQANPDGQPGVFIVVPGEPAPRLVHGNGEASVRWSADGGLFFVSSQDAVLAVRPDGQLLRSESALPSVSLAAPGGQLWTWSGGAQSEAGVWIGPLGQAGQRVFESNARGLSWSPDGQSLFFFSDGLYVARAPGFSPLLVQPGLGRGLAWVLP